MSQSVTDPIELPSDCIARAPVEKLPGKPKKGVECRELDTIRWPTPVSVNQSFTRAYMLCTRRKPFAVKFKWDSFVVRTFAVSCRAAETRTKPRRSVSRNAF